MADFHTHITTSTTLGAVYGLAGHVHWGMSPSTCLVATGLCGVAGVLPDVDSDSGHTQRELLTFLAAVTPMLMLDRFARLGFNHEQMFLAAGCVYVLVRFGFGEILRRYTVHRGMWHSLPAAAIAGLLVALLSTADPGPSRAYKVAAVILGYMIHLLLDELWAIEWFRGRFRLKKSFGTALKLFSRSWWANISTYGKLILIIGVLYGDSMIMEYLQQRSREWLYNRPALARPSDEVLSPEPPTWR